MQIVVPDEFKYLYVQSPERPIVKIPADVLRAAAKPIGKINTKTRQLAETMIKTMRKANGIGLAAPQLGVLSRMIVIAPKGMRATPLINPQITLAEGEMTGIEGCLSIPGLYGEVKRALKVHVEAFDLKGRPFSYELEGLPSRVVQHEIDHLDGILFIDKADPATFHWMNPETANEDAE